MHDDSLDMCVCVCMCEGVRIFIIYIYETCVKMYVLIYVTVWCKIIWLRFYTMSLVLSLDLGLLFIPGSEKGSTPQGLTANSCHSDVVLEILVSLYFQSMC